jgi:anti-sigma factor (TIGR02949 family)
MEKNNEHPCRNLLASLSDYVDGELGEDLCSEIERHMAGCENCQIVVDTLRKTIYLYHTTSSQTEIPPEIRQRLFLRLDLDEYISGA